MKKTVLLFVLFVISAKILFAGVDIDTVKFTDDNKKKNYLVEIRYPKIRNASTESKRDFNGLISDFVQKEKDSFYQEVTSDDYNEDIAFDLNIDFNVYYSDIHFISLVMYVYTFMGGAHGNTLVYSFNYDLDYNKKLELSDLFEGNYLNIISDYCIKEIKADDEYSDDEWIKAGAGPDKNNFSAFTLNSEGLIVHFQQYQVLPYAAGMPEVLIPQSVLKNVIRKDGLLAR